MTNKNQKKIAINLDLNTAQLIGEKDGEIIFLKELLSPVETFKREEGETTDKTKFGNPPEFASNNERNKHNIAQNEVKAYLKLLSDFLAAYDDILIFGNGKAKDQLKNHLGELKAFEHKKISVKTSDKLTPNQTLAYVREQWA